MCTMIAMQERITGSGKSGGTWTRVDTISVSYDHPFNMPLEYTLNLDFTSINGSPDQRVAVELDASSARMLVKTIQQVLKTAEEGGFLEE